jgi:signal transduction histidine kinase
MSLVRRTLTEAATYRHLVYLLSAIPFGPVWFASLTVLWSLCVGLVITPLVIPAAAGLVLVTRGGAAVEAAIARSLLAVDARTPGPAMSSGGTLWSRFRALFGASFWRAQAYLLLRWFVGFPLGVLALSVLVTAVGLIFAPIWVPFVPGGAHLGFWRPHTVLQAFALVPAGLVLLPAVLVAVNWLAIAARPLASGLLAGNRAGAATVDTGREPRSSVGRRQAFRHHAAVDGAVLLALTLIWALTSAGYFWPVWIALPFALALMVHGWWLLIDERPSLRQRFRGDRTLAHACGAGAAVALFLIGVWAITGHGYFWPVWPMLAIAAVLGVLTLVALMSAPDRAAMAQRIETLETSRAGAVDFQDSELRRIERDLHDGAQARLVALGLNLGMAEQKLGDDPERAGELIAEARVGAEEALRELRSLARGIHPPVLADRGLEAALSSLASSTPMRVELSVDLPRRPAPAVETAAYFVAAEALANAAKHARARRVEIRVAMTGEMLELQIEDDGHGGADPGGSGMLGMRRRVEALDGTLSVRSPAGGPTTILAELPCGS